jgi:hypothetical protein
MPWLQCITDNCLKHAELQYKHASASYLPTISPTSPSCRQEPVAWWRAPRGTASICAGCCTANL